MVRDDAEKVKNHLEQAAYDCGQQFGRQFRRDGTGRLSVHKIVGKDSSPRKPRQRKIGCGSTIGHETHQLSASYARRPGGRAWDKQLAKVMVHCQKKKKNKGGDVVMTRPREFRICKHWLNVLQYPVLQADNPQSWIKEFKDKEPNISWREYGCLSTPTEQNIGVCDGSARKTARQRRSEEALLSGSTLHVQLPPSNSVYEISHSANGIRCMSFLPERGAQRRVENHRWKENICLPL